MIKNIFLILALFFTLSCNDDLWLELNRVDMINKAQASRLNDLQSQINTLTSNVASSVENINKLISNAEDGIISNSEAILRLSEEALLLSVDIDSIQENIMALEGSIASTEEHLQGQIDETSEDIQDLSGEVAALSNEDELIIALLDSAVDDLEKAISEIEVLHVTNITEVTTIEDNYDDSAIVSDIRELFCDTDELADSYVLPPYSSTTAWIGIYEDNTKEVLIDSVRRVQFGEYPDYIFRHFDENGWIGAFGTNYKEMELPDFDYADTYQELVSGSFTEEVIHPDLGDIANLGIEVDAEIAFEFDPITGEYGGCANGNVIWYVNGEEVDKGANAKFEVPELNGDYIITAKFDNGDIAQHLVTRDDLITAKAAKKKGRVVVRRPII